MMYYYNNATLNECFMNTARTRTSVYNHAKTLGYRPSTATSSLVTLRFYLQEPYTADIYIPAYTICRAVLSSTENINFFTTENGIIYTGDQYVDIEAKAGNLNTDTFICNGVANYRYKLLNANVNEILSVTVDNLVYEYVEFMDINNKEGLYYTVKYDSDYHAYISFGDGTYGINPESGKIIRVLYVNGADKSSNVETNSITEIVSTIYDNNNLSVNSKLNVYNPDYATGGSNCETLDEIKRNSTTIYKTQKRAVTLDDYESLLLMKNGVSKVKAIDHTLIDSIGIFGVKLCVVPETNLFISNGFKKELKEYLEEKKIVSTQFEFIDPIFVPFDVSIDVKVLSTVNQKNIINNIKSEINKYLSWKNRDLGQSVSKNDIYKLVSDINGVSYINNITINENRLTYLIETPELNSNIIKIKDTMNQLTVGTIINIINSQGVNSLTAKISSISNGKYSLVDKNTNENIVITKKMCLSINNDVIPLLYVDTDTNYGSKKITIKNDDLTDSLLSRRNIILNNIQNSVIYFGDDKTNTYQILFRVGDEIYLDKKITTNLSKDTEINILYKKMIPILSDNAYEKSSILNLTEYPRFDVGAYLIKNSEPTYLDVTLTCQRSSKGIDYMSDYINMDNFVAIKKVYLNNDNILVRDEDYNIGDNGTSIVWTEEGKLKVYVNKTYFVDIIKKEINNNETKYYVTGINEKNINISPNLKENLYEGQTFSYNTDNYRLLYYEIADTGNITVNVTN